MRTLEDAAPYVDLQINGFGGVDFNDPTTSCEDICAALHKISDTGTKLCFPTVITANPEVMERCIDQIVQASERLEGKLIGGIHIEGPFLSPEAGYIGAHPPEYACKADRALLDRLLNACKDLPAIVTLAPEVDQNAELTRQCVERGVRVAAGHTNANLTELENCLHAGLSLFTHLGNGCPRNMDRHDNIIYRALHFRDQLYFSLIADGFHVPELLFRILLDTIPRARLLVVSDAISAAGLGPGVYQLGQRQVRIGEDRAARDASGEHFVGSASSMQDADCWLRTNLKIDAVQRRELLSENAATWLSLSPS